MTNLSASISEFNGFAIRATKNGKFSVYDVLVAFGICGKAHARQTLKRIQEKHPEVNTFCENFKFPGRGQRETPVADEEGIYQILMLCPGQRGVEFRAWTAKVVRERREEESNPELAYFRGRQRAIKTWRKQGKSNREIQEQLKAIESRHYFTDTLKAHGCTKSFHYANCTNEIYQSVLGSTAKELKAERGIAKSGRLRDKMKMSEIMAIGLAEALASEKMEEENANGYQDCKDASAEAGDRVSRVFN